VTELRAPESAVSGALRTESTFPAAAGAYGARRGAGKPAAKSPLRGCLSLRPEVG